MSTTVSNGKAKTPALMPEKLTTLEEHLAWVGTLNEAGVDLQPVIHALLEEKFQTQEVLAQVRAHQEALREEIEALCSPELYPVVVTGVQEGGRLTVEVAAGGGQRLRVAVHPDVPRDHLRAGARGILGKARNCLLSVEGPGTDWPDVGTFEDYLPDRQRVLIRHQEQLIAVRLSETLLGTDLRKGDLVGFDRDNARMAFSKVEQPGRQDLFFERTPPDKFEELGGLDAEISTLKWAVEFRLKHGSVADKYRLKAKRGILLEGPPGNGKTKMARCLANFVSTLVPAGECHFMAVAGSQDYSMWLGQSEQKLIARFEAARELATRSAVPIVMFFDEIDAIGRRRGSDFGSSAPDRILATFLSQLDGVQQVTNLIVIGATNRADVLDPGLLRPGRLGDLKVRVPPPGREAAKAIFERYLEGLPLEGSRDLIVKALLSKVYSDRGEYAEVARVGFRDGSKVVVRGRDLISGAVLENVVRTACEAAADREARTGQAGLMEDDLARSLDRELRGAVGLLTPGNVRGYVPRLPSERDPVGVEVVLTSGTGRYTGTE